MVRLRIAFALIAALLCSGELIAQKKIRAKPSVATQACGSLVAWRPDVATAMADAAKQNLPVFWYVPTLRDSRMDRKPEVDLYMRAGPFSSPPIIDLLNERFIPVRAIPDREMAEKFDLRRLDYIEPGFVVLASDGKLLDRVDRISTFHDNWFWFRLLRHAGPAKPEADRMRAARQVVIQEEEAEEAAAMEVALFALGAGKASDAAGRLWPWRVRGTNRTRFHYGAALWLSGRHVDAKAHWKDMAGTQDAWTQRAGAEAQGYGPVGRGLHSFRTLPVQAFLPTEAAGTRLKRTAKDREFIRRASIELLLDTQDVSGAWRDSIYDYGGTASLPNVYVAGTALAGLALHAHLVSHEGIPTDLLDRVRAARDRAIVFCLDEKNLALEDKNEIVYAHTFRAIFLARAIPFLRGDRQEKAQARLRAIARELIKSQLDNGSWRHEYPNPFVTAGAVHALRLAEAMGSPVPESTYARARQLLERARGDDGTYTYAAPRGNRRGAAVEFSAGRMPICELGLLAAGGSSQRDLEYAIQTAGDQQKWLDRVRKYDDHADQFGNGGFFFWYDLFYRAEAIDRLEDPAAMQKHRERLLTSVYSLTEFDGTFIDSHELGKSYGTAMALLVLASREF